MFSMLLATIVHGWRLPGHDGQPGTPLDVETFVANLLLLDASLNGALWAIQVEVLMAPVIVALYFVERSRGPLMLLAIAVVTSALSFSGGWAFWRPLSHNMFVFVLGMLVPTLGYRLVQGLSPIAARWVLLAVVPALFLTGPIFGFFSRPAALFEGYLAFVLVSLATYRLDVAGFRFLDHRPVRLLGLSSGSYYVLHMSLLVWIVPLVAIGVPAAWSLQVPALVGPATIATAMACLAVPALVSYYAVEAPGIALGRVVLSGRRRRAAH